MLINTPVAHLRDVIILTDGGVSNTSNVLQMVALNRTRNRIFSVGIGSGASTGNSKKIENVSDFFNIINIF